MRNSRWTMWHRAEGGAEICERAYDVCDVFSRPRTSQRARRRGMRGGWAIDWNYADPETGRTHDLLDPKVVFRVKQRLRRDRPHLIIVSPPCTVFSSLQNLNGGVTREAWGAGVRLFEVAVKICLLQASLGGLFVLEHL